MDAELLVGFNGIMILNPRAKKAWGSLFLEGDMKRRLLILTVAVSMVLTFSVSAKEIGGVSLPDSLTAGEKTLILNGAGLRKKVFVTVYAGGLYLTKKLHDPAKIIAADEPMAIRMHFIYDSIAAAKLTEVWNEGFANATAGNITPIKQEIDTFNSFFTEDAKKGDIYDIVYIPGEGVIVHIKGQVKGTIKGFEFKKAVFSIWLGEKPADSSLKKGMLGE